MNRILGVVICLILVAILVVQIFIYSTTLHIVQSIPPTMNDLVNARNNQARIKELLRRQSIRHCYIDQSIEVNVTNTPEVEIIR